MSKRLTRRDMLRSSAVAGVGLWLSSSRVITAAPSDKLNIAVIGIGGRGGANLGGVSKQNIVALCDVDAKRGERGFKKFPAAKKYHDFREMLDDTARLIDAVVISTPDHTHFHPAYMAMQMGKHCYLEKPMAHNVWESRTLTKLAAEKKLATQLGVQRHTIKNMHRIVEIIKSGAIGEIKEVHSWVGGTRGMPGDPKEFPPVPAHLKWDLWLGPTAERRYSPGFAPYDWRFWWDYGTGETGNWGCHILDIPYWALDLKYPTRVEGSGPPVHPEKTSKSMKTTFQFPARGDLPPVTLSWYHTKSGPEVLKKLGLPNKGNNLFIGSKGMLLCDFGKRKLYPEKDFADFKEPAPSIPDSPGFYNEWITACKGGKAATCNFDYSGPMAETVLLGNLAYRAGVAFDWDAENLKASAGGEKVAALIKEPYRKGWDLASL